MKVYRYNEITREYIGTLNAQPNPRVPGEYLMPANTTTMVPIEAPENWTVVFNGAQWVLIDDFRGTTGWNKTTKEEITVDYLGVNEEITFNQPPELKQFASWSGSGWTLNEGDVATYHWENLRNTRNAKMSQCDWTQLPDVLTGERLTSEQVSEWAVYRQTLANLPDNTTDPANPVWPNPPMSGVIAV